MKKCTQVGPGLLVAGFVLSLAGSCWAAKQSVSFGATPAQEVELLRKQIDSLEADLLQSEERNSSALIQLKKIRRLMDLQKKEISLSEKKIQSLQDSLEDLSGQKAAVDGKMAEQKKSLSMLLRELQRLTDDEPFDFSWLKDLDSISQKQFFLKKRTEKSISAIRQLHKESAQALALESRIIDEKNKLDYYIHDLRERSAVLASNQEVLRDITRTNRANHLDAMRHIRLLHETEKEIEKKMTANPEPADSGSEPAPFRAKLPMPVSGLIVGEFGRSYDSKTNLFTFQKGITISASTGAEVRSVEGGKVVFAGPLKNYGQIVIVEHPGQYFTLYGQLGALKKSQGDSVSQGDVVGVAAKEAVYFEIRKRNIAVNPLQWLNIGQPQNQDIGRVAWSRVSRQNGVHGRSP